MTIRDRAFQYAKQYDDKYQLAMAKAYIDGAEKQEELDNKLLQLHINKSKEIEAELKAEIKKLQTELEAWKH